MHVLYMAFFKGRRGWGVNYKYLIHTSLLVTLISEHLHHPQNGGTNLKQETSMRGFKLTPLYFFGFKFFVA